MSAQFYQITLDSETIGGGWKLYHYAPGTTTLKDVWLDRDKISTAAQPILADANGVVSFYADGLYDLVAKTSAGVLKYTWEDVFIVETPSLGIEGTAIGSAATLTLGASNEIYYHITGTNTVQAISGSQAFVILTFDSTPTLTDSATFQLRNRTSRQARADETIWFVNDGAGTWREVSAPLRLPNNAFITGRNAAGTAEINLIKANASDQIELGTTVKNFSLDADPTTALQASTKQYVDNSRPLSVQNPIINGNMEVWQRGTAFAAAANLSYSADRWKYYTVGAGVVTINRSTNVPTVAQAGVLFNYSLEVDVTTADASIGAADAYSVRHIIEGYNWRHFAQRDIILSFRVLSSKTGVHTVGLLNSGGDRVYVAEYTVNSADTWEYKTIAVPASPSSGTWNYTNGAGLYLVWNLAAGSNYHMTPNVWGTTAGVFSTANQVNVLDNIANFFRLTGVKLELGSAATPVQFAPFEEELSRCKRYYQKSFRYATAPVQNAGTGSGEFNWPANGTGAVSTYSPSIQLVPQMRIPPTVTLYNVSAANAEIRNVTDGADLSGSGYFSAGDSSFILNGTGNAGLAFGDSLQVNWAADAEL